MNIKLIKSEADYRSALSLAESLMDSEPGSPEEEELELVTILIERYEKEHVVIEPPDPVEAILFRMEQQGLTRKDLEKFIGSQGKVSEILNRKRSLSLSMIRSLHDGLDIPYESLMGDERQHSNIRVYNWHDFPFTEMVKHGYFRNFNGSLNEAKQKADELLNGLFRNLQNQSSNLMYCRHANSNVNENALMAWQAVVQGIVNEYCYPEYIPNLITPDWINEVVRLSKFEQGPLLAKELLEKFGIPLVIIPVLSGTYLDGASFMSSKKNPVIGLTLRFDRLDNFWFTLIHELAHVHLHLKKEDFVFFDDTEHRTSSDCYPEEIEADDFTSKVLIPERQWQEEQAKLIDDRSVIDFANQLGISPAIVAGRLRYEQNNYQIFTHLVGHKKVRELFSVA